MPNETLDGLIKCRIEKAKAEAFNAIAEQRHRTPSNLARLIIEEFLEREASALHDAPFRDSAVDDAARLAALRAVRAVEAETNSTSPQTDQLVKKVVTSYRAGRAAKAKPKAKP